MPRTCGACRCLPVPCPRARSPQRRLGAGRAQCSAAVRAREAVQAYVRPQACAVRTGAACAEARHGQQRFQTGGAAARSAACGRRQSSPQGLCLRAQSSTHAACCAFAMRSSDACACFLCVSTTRSSSAPYGSTCRASALTHRSKCARGAACPAANVSRAAPRAAAVPFGSISLPDVCTVRDIRTHARTQARTRRVDAWCMQRMRGASPSATARACLSTHRCRPPPHSPRAAAPHRSVVATPAPG